MKGISKILLFFIAALLYTVIMTFSYQSEPTGAKCDKQSVTTNEPFSIFLRSGFTEIVSAPVEQATYHLVPFQTQQISVGEYTNLLESLIKDIVGRSMPFSSQKAIVSNSVIGTYFKPSGKYYIFALRHILI